jgi:hypothetical protein
MPEQLSPLQPVKLEVDPAAADKVTTVLLAKSAEQVAPQLMPVGTLVTVPEPVPFLLTIRAYKIGVEVAVGVSVLDAVAVGVYVLDAVAVGVKVLVAVEEGVLVQVWVGVDVNVEVGVPQRLNVNVSNTIPDRLIAFS